MIQLLAIVSGILGGIVIYGFWYLMIFFLLFMKYAYNPIMGIINKFRVEDNSVSG